MPAPMCDGGFGSINPDAASEIEAQQFGAGLQVIWRAGEARLNFFGVDFVQAIAVPGDSYVGHLRTLLSWCGGSRTCDHCDREQNALRHFHGKISLSLGPDECQPKCAPWRRECFGVCRVAAFGGSI